MGMMVTHHECNNGSNKPVCNMHKNGCALHAAKYGKCGISLISCKKEKKDYLIYGTRIKKIN